MLFNQWPNVCDELRLRLLLSFKKSYNEEMILENEIRIRTGSADLGLKIFINYGKSHLTLLTQHL